MKKTARYESNSLKTFYLYVVLVFIVICIALLIKGFFVVQESKFDPAHDFIIAVTSQGDVKEIVAFHPEVPSVATLIMQSKTPYATLAKTYGIHTDGYIQINDATVSSDITAFMWSSCLHTDIWQSNLTIIDKIRLMLLARSITTNNKTVDDISLSTTTPDASTQLTTALTDQDIANENISIQIINATDIAGFGQRLGRVLSTMGANVVQISTATDTQSRSTIAYYGNDSYTLQKLEKMLAIPATKLQRQQIADIVITLGTDKSKTPSF